MWLGIGLGPAVSGSHLGAIIALCMIAWEGYVAVTFVRAPIRTDARGIEYRTPYEGCKAFIEPTKAW